MSLALRPPVVQWFSDCTWKRMENPEDTMHEGAMIRGGPDIATFVCTITPVPPCWLPSATNFKGRFCGYAVGRARTYFHCRAETSHMTFRAPVSRNFQAVGGNTGSHILNRSGVRIRLHTFIIRLDTRLRQDASRIPQSGILVGM